MIEIVKVLSVLPLGPSRLRIRFSDGSWGEHDFARFFAEGGPMVREVREQGTFAAVFLQMGTLTWPNGLALDSIALHAEMSDAGELVRPAA
ncbi:hypothetical protein STAQ_01870 [Allostella sp. ATCC 35155]|nr:hypothetical protein STAQ_01870 [Stella sp. ATCC 35155]